MFFNPIFKKISRGVCIDTKYNENKGCTWPVGCVPARSSSCPGGGGRDGCTCLRGTVWDTLPPVNIMRAWSTPISLAGLSLRTGNDLLPELCSHCEILTLTPTVLRAASRTSTSSTLGVDLKTCKLLMLGYHPPVNRRVTE